MTTHASPPHSVATPCSDPLWNASSPVDFTVTAEDAFACDKIVVVGKRSAAGGELFLQSVPALLQPALTSLLTQIAPGNTGGSRTVCLVNGDDTLTEIILAILPEQKNMSRHNAPSGSHAAFALLKNLKAPKNNKSLGIVCALSSANESSAIASAVAKAFPTYTAKSVNLREGEDTGVTDRELIAQRGPVKVAMVCSSDGSDGLKVSTETKTRAASVASAVRFASRIVDTPPAQMDPDALVNEALGAAEGLRTTFPDIEIEIKTLRYDELVERGFGGIAGVGRAAAKDGREPALVVLTHKGKGVDSNNPTSTGRSTALVGKGITFDTGGLQIKGKAGMCGMKTDLGGAAATLGSWRALVEIDPTSSKRGGGDLHVVLCIAENAVGSGSFRPDDVLTSKSGKTMEINNTDAEGRLVLADGVAFASQELNVDDIIDMATLTGAQMVATGRFFAGIVSDSEELEIECIQAGKVSGDLCHPLPYAPEFFTSEFSSNVADMKNSVKDRSNAQASCAGQFIANHLSNDWVKDEKTRWLHVDIAGPSTEKGSGRGTGFGVGLLVELLLKE